MTTLAAIFSLYFAITLLPPGHGETLPDYTVRLLRLAPQNFVTVRGALDKRKSYQVTYALSKSAPRCESCEVVNEFAWPHHPETWYVSDRWRLPESWSPEQVSEYVLKQFTPLVRGYDRTTVGSKKYPTRRWSNSKTKTWVEVDAFHGGFSTKIGRDLSNPVHELHEATIDEMQMLRTSIANFIKAGTSAAPYNFASLRGAGKRDVLGTMTYRVTDAFGPMLDDCSISDDTENVLQLPNFSPRWTFYCTTSPLVASHTALLAEVQQAVTSALDSTFSVTEGKLRGYNDYRWDSSSNNVAVSVGSLEGYLLPKGLAQNHVSITHFVHERP